MDKFLSYKGYMGTIDYLSGNDSYYGIVLGVPHHSVYTGANIDELRVKFERIVEEYIEHYVVPEKIL